MRCPDFPGSAFLYPSNYAFRFDAKLENKTNKLMRLKNQIALRLILLSFVATFSSCHFLPSTPYTGGLPQVDKVELFKLELRGDLWTGKFDAQKTLMGDETYTIAALWRNQSFNNDSPICHNPGYAIKFYAKDKLLVYATLCWDCDNIEFLTPKLENYISFEGSGTKGQELLKYLKNMIPEGK